MVCPLALPQTPATDSGAGVTKFEAAEADPAPTLLVAVTVNV